jgi:hypothetical protein
MAEAEEKLTVQFIDKPERSKDKPIMDVVDEALNKVVRFVNRDIDEVIEYIDVNDIPVHFITANKRIDMHPARVYLLTVPKTMRDVVQLKKLMDTEDDDLDNFFADEK